MGALPLEVDPTMTGTPPPSSLSTLEGYAASHPQFQVTSSVPALLGQAVTMARQVGGAVVDVGCGEGGTLAALRGAGRRPRSGSARDDGTHPHPRRSSQDQVSSLPNRLRTRLRRRHHCRGCH